MFDGIKTIVMIKVIDEIGLNDMIKLIDINSV